MRKKFTKALLLCLLPLLGYAQGGIFIGYNGGLHKWRNLQSEAYEFNVYHLQYDKLMSVPPYYKGLNLGYTVMEEEWGMMLEWSNKHVKTHAKGVASDGVTWEHSRKVRMNTWNFSMFVGNYPYYIGASLLSVGKMKSFEKNAPESEFGSAKYERWDVNTKKGILAGNFVAGWKIFGLVYLPVTDKTAIQFMPFYEFYLGGAELDYSKSPFDIKERHFNTNNFGLSASLHIGPKY